MTRALGLLLILLAGPGWADEAGWRALAEPGTVGMMRHADAPGTGDPPGFRLDDCATQRNLSDAGRAQARAVGEAVRARGIVVDRVLTSQWCRCRETAELLSLAAVEPWPALNSLRWDKADKAAQITEVKRLMAANRAGALILVTHQFNITELTGLPVASGEIIAVRLGEGEKVEVRGRIPPPGR
jgi:phosphohistidine phosphatase SixA